MNLYPLSVALLFLCFLTAAGESPTHFTGEVSINCGSSGTSAALDGREWLGDVKPKFSSMLQIKGSSSTTATAIHKFIYAAAVPHRTARISRSKFSYEFQVSPGQKVIRLYFHPTLYKGFKGFQDLFTVESGPFTLLSNFSASLTAHALGMNSFVKEFCLNVQENGRLSIGFSPSSLDAYAFINGIEIISVPASLSYFQGGDIGVQVVGHKSPVYLEYNTALEVIHRMSIKQSSVRSAGDFDGIFPMWATRRAKKDKSSTWKIPVDMGFRYLIRLHFSELGLKIAETDDVIFKVLINEMVADTNIDIVKERNDDNIPWYRDYMLLMRGNKKEGKRHLLISLQSYDELIDGHGLLAGFEIFKLSNPDNSLASPNPFPPSQDSPSLLWVLGHRNAIATVAITIIALVNIIVHKSRETWEASRTEEENKPSARAERQCRRFSFAEIQLATENFSDALLIGKGGFGRVYKGLIDKGQNIVAVKRLKLSSSQGSHEFLTEIEMLSQLRHVNLVSLIGYCNEHGEMILVYDYMACGTLADHLYKLQRESSNCCSLTWKQRLDICIGAGRGLDYLHTGHGIIHRDVKASNILLDENFVAKVSDFGLAKPEDGRKLKSYVSTKVKGTFGYLDPYYFNTQKLTRKSDTYAFGVVLLEVLCGRPAVVSRVAENEHILSKWALDYIRKGEVDQIIASNLRDEISSDSLKTFVGVAERCLCHEPKNRPTMSQVVLQLESALEQQENKEQLESALEQQENKELVALNETTGAFDDSCHCNDEINLLAVNKGKLKIASSDEQHQTNSKVVNSELLSGRKDGRRATILKPLRLWPRDGFWNRVKPSKKNKLSSYGVLEIVTIAKTCEEISAADIKLAKFDWNKIAAATNNFSYSNQVGEGGFGPVYKAALPKGQVVAVKSLSPSSVKGLKEFKNEILLVQNLRHQNIIKLLGYCFHKQEKFLVYEFMENGSLMENLLVVSALQNHNGDCSRTCLSTSRFTAETNSQRSENQQYFSGFSDES
ncbi:Serine/threonine protein kinase [Handroanthus impetiginosus]|uniref:Serine/threonine protein kinase n=1 Tax=Handroanthus impetiginosus TaxID=429701 RepID=A0A2G9H0X4_9LAMI|nr:Serine/threonine protein kinase [Handroanthus impetiginosus]